MKSHGLNETDGTNPGHSDPHLEALIQTRMGSTLFWGMMVCVAIIAAGGILYIVQHWGIVAHFDTFSQSPNQPRTLHQMWRGILNGYGGDLIALGALLLVLLQYIRVALSLVMFVRLRARIFVGICIFILASLVAALIV